MSTKTLPIAGGAPRIVQPTPAPASAPKVEPATTKAPLFIELLLTKVTGFCVAMLVLGMVGAIWVSVFTRYITTDPVSWGEQVAKYLMIWAAFLGASLGVREGAHIAVTVVVGLFPEHLKKWCAHLVSLLNISFLSVCIYYGVLFAYKVKDHADPLVGNLSMSVPYAAIPVGCFLMLLQTLFVMRRGAVAESGSVSLT